MDSIGWTEILLLIVSFGTFLGLPALLIAIIVLLVRKKEDGQPQNSQAQQAHFNNSDPRSS